MTTSRLLFVLVCLGAVGPLLRAAVDYSGQNRTGANFVGQDLSGAKLTGTNLTNANLDGAGLQAANLTGAILTGATFKLALFDALTVWPAGFNPLNKGMIGPGVDLSGVTFLPGKYRPNTQAPNANFSGAVLEGGGNDYYRSNFSGSNFTGANLRAAFGEVNFTNANLTNANLDGAGLQGATLTGATLTGASFKLAHFDALTIWPAGFNPLNKGMIGPGVDLSGVIFPPGRYRPNSQAPNANFSGASLEGSGNDYYRSNFSGSNFTGANLRAGFSEVNFTKAKLTNANLDGAALQGANLTEAILSGANLRNSNLTGAVLSGALYDSQTLWPTGFDPVAAGAVRISGDYSGQNRTGANFAGQDLSGAVLIGTNLTNANLTNTNLTNARLEGAILTGATLTGTTLTGARFNAATLWPSGFNAAAAGAVSVPIDLGLGLVAHYPFEGDANDVTAYANHGVVKGATLTTDRRGRPNAAYRFSGNQATIEAPHAAQQNQLPFTLSVWFRSSAPLGQSASYDVVGLVSKYSSASWNGWQLGFDEKVGSVNPWYLPSYEHCVIGDYGQPPFESPGALADGLWHHAVLTVDSSEGVLYVDGEPVARQSWRGTATPTAGNYPLIFGAYPGGTTLYYTGDLDDVRLYRRALPPREVAALHASESAGGDPFTADLATRWKLEGDASDASGRAPGVAQGVQWVTQTVGRESKPVAYLGGAAGAGIAVPKVPALDLPASGYTILGWVMFPSFPTSASYNDYFTLIGSQGLRGAQEDAYVLGYSPYGLNFQTSSQDNYPNPDAGSRNIKFFRNTETTADSLPSGQWSLVAVTYDGATLRGYIDGVALRSAGNTALATTAPKSTTRATGLGLRNSFTPGTYYAQPASTGYLSDIRIYRRALTAEELRLVYHLQMGAQPQVITFAPLPNRAFGTAPFTLTASASSGLPVEFAVVAGPATLSGNTVTLTGTGNVTLRATQPGNTTYRGAVAVEQTFTVQVRSTAPIPTSGLIAHYPFSGNAQDATVQANHGTVAEATLTADRFGVPNRAYEFNGTSASISIPHADRLNRYPLTVAAWFRAAGPSVGHLVNKYLNASWNGWALGALPRPTGERSVYALYLAPGANIIGDYGNPPFWANTRIDDQAWHHVVFTVDASGGKLYLDGVLVSERAWVGPPTVTTNTLPLTIGGDPRDRTFFQGAIDDVVIYDRALNAAEVQALFAADNDSPGETVYFASRSAAGRNFIGRLGPDGAVTELAGGFTGRINQLVAGPDGALYGANTDENRIQRFGLDGTVSSWAAGGLLSNPNGLIFDAAGNMLVANYAFPSGGKVIRIAPNGTMSVFSPLLGSGGGALAFDTQGNLYAAEYIQNAITRITPAGVATNFQSGVSSPTGLVFDASGNLFVGNQGYGGSSPGITRITPAGVATRVGSGAPYNYVNGLALDEVGNLLATNAGGDNFLRVTPAGTVSVLANGTGSTTGVTVVRNTFGTPWPSVWVRTGPAVAQGALQFVNGRLVNLNYSSTDGRTWTAITHPAYSFWINNLGGGDGTFVLTGPQGQLWTSPDLATWTRRTTPDTDDLTTVVHGNGVFLVRKFWQTGAMLRSADGGATWATVATGSAPSRFYNELAFGQGRFVYALDRAVRTSVDGLSWQETAVPTAPGTFSFNQGPLVFDGARFVSAAETASSATQRTLTVATSGDGLAWTFRTATVATPRTLRLLGAGAGMIVVGGSDAAGSIVLLSRDAGTTWTEVTAPPYAADTGLSRLVFAAGRAVLSGSAGFYTATSSGLTPQSITFPPLASRIFGEAPFAVGTPASSGLPVTLSVVSGPATVAGQIVTLTGAGSVVLRATQGGNATFAPATAEQTLSVAKAVPVIQWAPAATVVQGTVLGATQLNATATPAGGAFTYTPAAGVTLSTPGTQVLSATYAPAPGDAANYASVTVQRTITVSAAPFVPAVQLTAEPGPSYLAGGGNGTFRVRVSYVGQTPSSLGVTVNLPAGWGFVSATAPASAAAPAPGTSVLEWAFATVPANELNFTFVAAYPAGQLGTKTLAGFATYRPGPVEVPFGDLQLSPVTAPEVRADPASRLAAVQTGVVFTVSAAGTAPLTYRWLRNGVELAEDTRITGTGSTALSVANLSTADAGSYSVRVSNAAGSATSAPAVLTVLDVRATHSLQDTGYAAGGTVTVAQTLTFADPAGALGWQMLVPDGWTYASGTGGEGEVRPVPGTAGLLEWAWTALPASPVQFNVTLNVPFGTTGPKEIVALAIHRSATGILTVLARPDPLVLSELTYHSADTNRDYRISLLELTRLIELYNARNGATRTGAYGIAAEPTEDGFYPDLRLPVPGPILLPRYHGADTNRDGRLSLLELTRIIELYNYRSPGGTRTGEYHLHPGSEDGFNPGPISVHPER